MRRVRPDVPSRSFLDEAGTISRYILCGEFAQRAENGSSAWSPFVTIQTSDYEQLLDSQTTTFCENPLVTWLRDGLTTDLHTRLDSPEVAWTRGA